MAQIELVRQIYYGRMESCIGTDTTLIYPDFDLPFFWRQSYWINHGLASISSYAKSRGHTVRGLDLRLLKDWDDFSRRIYDDRPITGSPKIFGIYMGTWNFDIAHECLRIIKKLWPEVSRLMAVVGSRLVATLGRDVLKHKNKKAGD